MPINYAAKFWVCTGILLLLGACSSFTPSARLLTGLKPGPAFSFSPSVPGSTIYRQDGDAPNPFFFAAIQDCSFNKRSSTASAARQLLVGLEKIKILERTNIDISGTSLVRTRITAALEGHGLDLVSYTRKDGRCVQDYILWRNDANQDSLGIKTSELASFETYLGSILPKEGAGVTR
ncbi:MAG: hypothetical protein GX589_00900 [Deltaproteobacteria bacterium]|nr:hypothetical protein [Deltaproteobacteria bacterium]